MLDAYGRSNAKTVKNLRRPMSRSHTLQRFQSIAWAFVEGPSNIYVRRDAEDYKRDMDFELILRIVMLTANERLASWSVYSPEREWESETEEHRGYVLRYSSWDIQSALTNRPWKNEDAPQLSTVIWYLADKECNQLVQYCKALDSLLIKGVSLEPRTKDDAVPSWDRLFVFRSLDSIQIDIRWDSIYSNFAVEKTVLDVSKTLEETVGGGNASSAPSVDLLEMVYDPLSQEVEEFLYK